MFASGRLDGDSSLRDVPFIGPYLFGRLRRALQIQGDLDVATFQRRLRQRTRANKEKFLLTVLQNERANQCVRPSPNGRASFHAPDVNYGGYEALVAVLDADRATQLPPRLQRRSAASKTCACRSVCDGVCIRTADGACVPRNARLGFPGAHGHAAQIVRIDSAADAARLRRQSLTRRTAQARRDPDTARDLQRHSHRMTYSRRGRYAYRTGSPKVRAPIV